MSLEGTTDEKLNCIIEGQDTLCSRIKSIESEAKSRGVLLGEHIKRFDEHRQYEEHALKENAGLAANIQDVLYHQKVLLEERQDSIDFWKQMKEKIATAGLLGALGLLGSALVYAFQSFIQHGPK